MSAEQQQGNDGPLTHDVGEMLLGTMRDGILEAIRPIVNWSKLKEAQQHKINNAVEQACRREIRDAAPIIAGRGFDTISTTVGDINTKGELVIAKLSAERTRENILGLAEAGRCTLVLVDPEVFMGAKPAAVMKDQPDLMDGTETPEQRANREAIDAEAAEHEASVARARQFKPTDDAGTLGGAVAKVVGDMLPPAIKAAADRGAAYRRTGGARNVPEDLANSPEEASAWLAAYDVAGASAAEDEAGEAAPEPTKPPRGHRGKRTSTEEHTAKRLAEASA